MPLAGTPDIQRWLNALLGLSIASALPKLKDEFAKLP
jgi:hypothetical protein